MRIGTAARRVLLRIGFGAVLVAAGGASAQEKDRHAGYYYPPATVTESYQPEATTLTGSTRVRRVGFVTILVNKQLTASYAPPYMMFAKGADSEKRPAALS